MLLNKSESMNFVTSCHQTESCVIPACIGDVWEQIRAFNFSKLFPSYVKNVKFVDGNCNSVGSLFTFEYVDGSVWTFKLLEISESRRVISFDLISAEPEVGYSSMMTVFRFNRVTDTNETYFAWESDYANDVNAHAVQDAKFKKLEAFKDIKNFYTKK